MMRQSQHSEAWNCHLIQGYRQIRIHTLRHITFMHRIKRSTQLHDFVLVHLAFQFLFLFVIQQRQYTKYIYLGPSQMDSIIPNEVNTNEAHTEHSNKESLAFSFVIKILQKYTNIECIQSLLSMREWTPFIQDTEMYIKKNQIECILLSMSTNKTIYIFPYCESFIDGITD